MLQRLRGAGLATAILSNGEPAMLRDGAESAGIDGLLDHILSVEEVGVFKPAAEVYLLATQRLGLPARKVAFVSSNGWDAHGAAWFGFQVYWANRAGAPHERLPGELAAVMTRSPRPAGPAAGMTMQPETDEGAPILPFADIEAAAARLAGVAVRTPLLESEALNGMVGGRLLLKAEPPPAHRHLQVPRRLQRHRPDRRSGRGRLLLGQPRPGGGHGRAPPGQGRHHRDAGRRSGHQACRHRGPGCHGRRL